MATTASSSPRPHSICKIDDFDEREEEGEANGGSAVATHPDISEGGGREGVCCLLYEISPNFNPLTNVLLFIVGGGCSTLEIRTLCYYQL